MSAALDIETKNIKFTCPKCSQHIVAPGTAEGAKIECPTCQEELEVPHFSKARRRALCPRCKQKIKLPPESLGTEIVCPVCKLAFKLPELPRKKSFNFPKLPRPPRWVIATGVAAVLLACAVGYWSWSRTPTYSLLRVQSAMQEHDFATFQKYVDIDSVVTRFIDDMMLLGLIEAGEDEAPGAMLGAAVVQLFKPRLIEEAKKQLNRFVEAGTFANTNSALKPALLFSQSKRFQGISSVRKEGKIALVSLSFTSAEARASHELQIKLRDMGSYWQVAELSNVAELSQRVRSEEKAARELRNAPIRATIARSVKLVALNKNSVSDQYGINNQVEIRINAANTSKFPILGYSAVIRPKDAEGRIIKELRVRSSKYIPPEGTALATWSFEVNKFIKAEAELYKYGILPSDVEFTRVVFQGGATLEVEE